MHILASLLVFLFTLTASAVDCSISSEDRSQLLKLPYKEFDQNMAGGWRKYGERGCYALGAELLEEYAQRHGSTMLDWQLRVIIWHAGQMYAHLNDYQLAKERFKKCFDPTEPPPPDALILWNDYVAATIAFLDKDLKALTYSRDRIAAGPNLANGTNPNLRIVNCFIKHFDKPYKIAYSCQ